MKTLLFLFLAGYTVRCDDNYYVVRVPQNIKSKEFKVYWNVPTMQCKSKKIPFEDLYEKYGIIQNTNDTHRGDRISILYDPGNFPALIKNETTGELRYRNGGVPQQGSLIDHLQIFKHEMEKSIPDENFDGVGIIDFESWRPILRQNFGVLAPYKEVSYDIEKTRHWWWKKQWIQEEAKRRFEEAGREFMQTTIALAKKLRPKALWGYYGYPQCFNRAFNSNAEKCADEIPAENDEINWLWSESTALFPSVYSTKEMTKTQLTGFISGRIKESERVRQKGTPILPYWWFRYRDDGYFTQSDLDVAFSTFYKSDATGFIIWGSSKDVNTKEKCLQLKEYVTNTLGPTIAKFTKPNNKTGVMFDDITSTAEELENITDSNKEYNGVLPENYSLNIEHIVEQELKNENETKFEINNKAVENSLLTIILHKIANYCSENCYNRISTDVVPPVLTTKDPFKEGSVRYDSTAPNITEDDEYIYDYIYKSTIPSIDKNDSGDYETTSTIKTVITKTKNGEKSSHDTELTEIKPFYNNLNITNVENFSTEKSITHYYANDKFNYSDDSTATIYHKIFSKSNDTKISWKDTSAIKLTYNDSTHYVKLYDANFNRNYYTGVTNTAVTDEQNSTIIWSTRGSSIEDIVDTSASLDNITVSDAANISAGPVLTEQVVISVV